MVCATLASCVLQTSKCDLEIFVVASSPLVVENLRRPKEPNSGESDDGCMFLQDFCADQAIILSSSAA